MCIALLSITHTHFQAVEWTRWVVRKLDDEFNCLIRLLLFDNIKASLKVGWNRFNDLYTL